VEVPNERTNAGMHNTTRRGFLNGFLGTTLASLAAAVLYPVLRFLAPPRIPETPTNQVLAGTVSELSRSKSKIFPFGSEAAILIEIEPGDYRAFSAVCTHLSCTVQYDEPGERFICACHNGAFDLNGRNVSGPPPAPLTPFEVKVTGDDIFVIRA